MSIINGKLNMIEQGRVGFTCPGCKTAHVIQVEGPKAWGWNGSGDAPTFTPSVLVTWPGDEERCHSFVTNGKVHFLSDCTHDLAGQTVDLPAWQGW